MLGLKSLVVICALFVAQSTAAPRLEARTTCPGTNQPCDTPGYRCCGISAVIQYCMPTSVHC
ncbi:hypothetical protein BDQ12DRAFT_692839 [Crucibulum laeve]|uniref:CBM1 domain-containing protein n=1 Tax=Crucibulum laeve TaxID=68775 RepID=A0A5C3LGF7_9AGAR|nr:hypothetical protein BDQ12DRAFT_692839 [Crucibulum laeve]